VNFVWLERKVMEWGCMQALIDFDGWRQWKDFSQDGGREDDSKDSKVKGSAGSGGSGGKKKKHRPSAGSSPSASNSQMLTKELGEPVGLGVDNGL
jgi:osomolarity two-component system, response regulator SSK1